ncbi:magnesium/cobalt transporter CorA [Rariglobus hedericola]|uniref:Magnesium transport protein CorA n=1 Tax=Rariglobus hedericola TaxID=2597822 RepID=A0A556QRJ3_9BACT|nr:magnesium/cobalt transporter CorA [Rariglobus hedericola]TSJ79260.1 magnesium/cobalt transporter CorA [Rariglobus hedericola]
MIHSFIFSDGKLVGRDLEIEALRLVRSDKGLVLWVDLENPTDEEIKFVLSEVFQFHPLAIEDCVTPSALPKLEDYDDYLFIVMHAVDFTRTEKFNTTEIDFFLGKDYLVTFHHTPLKSVTSVMDRCVKSTGIVARGPDRIAHMVLDALVDNFKPITDELRGELELIEETVLGEGSDNLTSKLLEVRGELNHLRQIVRPQRDIAARLAHGESKIIRSIMYPYFRDLRDNLVRIDETAASYADQLLISFDLYLSKSGFAANEGIKVLTALTAITLPAILIGTWYGMNFSHMPELQSRYGYPIVVGLTGTLTVIMWTWCKRRRWI